MSKVEELEAEIEKLLEAKRDKIKAELEKEAEEERKREEEQARKSHEEALRSTIKEELKKGMNISKVVQDTDVEKRGTEQNEFQEFKENFTKKKGITGDRYEDYIKKLAYGDYKR